MRSQEDRGTFPTGLTHLDRMTGGGSLGDVWLMAGPPGTPVPLLALTSARATALLARRSVRWLSTYEEPAELAASVAVAEARCLSEDLIAPRDHQVSVRLGQARARLAGASLGFTRVAPASLNHAADRVLSQQQVDVLVLDHITDIPAEVIGLLKRQTVATHTWLVLVSRATSGGPKDLLNDEQGSADVLVWVEHPDLHEPHSPRCGEVDLTVFRRGRRKRTEIVAFQPHYRRYVNAWLEPPY